MRAPDRVRRASQARNSSETRRTRYHMGRRRGPNSTGARRSVAPRDDLLAEPAKDDGGSNGGTSER